MLSIRLGIIFLVSIGFLAYADTDDSVWPVHPAWLSNQGNLGDKEPQANIVFTLTLDQFMQSLTTYRLNAPWITKDFMELSLHDFNHAWEEVTDILIRPERHWFYFCDKKEDFYEEDYWLKFLWQCQYYDTWIQQTYVNISTGEVLYKEEAALDPEHVMPLMYYWDSSAQETGKVPYVSFYTFYIDCLSVAFCKAIESAYQQLDETTCYNTALSAAKRCLERITVHLVKMKKSPLYASYMLTIKKYQEIMSLLEQEKFTHLLGGLDV